MNHKIEKLYYASDDITGEWQLCAWGEDQQGRSFCKDIDMVDANRLAKVQGCGEFVLHMAVPSADGSVDLFVFDIQERKNKVISIKPLFK